MNKLLILSAMALLLPIAPALACFPEDDETKEVLFAAAGLRGRTSDETAFQFGRDPIPMSFCEKDEPGFAVVNGKCYDTEAITDFDNDEDCYADEICKAYREQQKQEQEPGSGPEPEPSPCDCPEGGICEQLDCGEPIPGLQPQPDRTDDPNHGEIKGDEELGLAEQGQDEEEHQEEEEQGEEKSEETTAETSE